MADEILRLLVDAHETEFTVPELVDTTETARSTVWRAVDLLDWLGVASIRETTPRNDISIDPERLQNDGLAAAERADMIWVTGHKKRLFYIR